MDHTGLSPIPARVSGTIHRRRNEIALPHVIIGSERLELTDQVVPPSKRELCLRINIIGAVAVPISNQENRIVITINRDDINES